MINTKYFTSKITPTISTDAYAAGDIVGGLLSIDLDVAQGGIINDVKLFDKSNQQVALSIYLFEATLDHTAIVDNAAFTLTHAQASNLIARIDLSDYTTLATNTSVTTAEDINITFSVTNTAYYAQPSLYAYIATNATTPTYTATDDLTLVIRGVGA